MVIAAAVVGAHSDGSRVYNGNMVNITQCTHMIGTPFWDESRRRRRRSSYATYHKANVSLQLHWDFLVLACV